MKIAIVFFGITRSLTYTHSSITKNIIAPAQQFGTVELIGHFFLPKIIQNIRSGECGTYDECEYNLLNFDQIKLDHPIDFSKDPTYLLLKQFGDNWSDNFASFNNIFHQLHSLNVATEMALKRKADVYLFIRPDLLYHDSFKKVLAATQYINDDHIFIPSWQHWGGFNDRFSICVGARAAHVYGKRFEELNTYARKSLTLQGERFLKNTIAAAGIRTKFIAARASRVRLNGHVHKEDFCNFRIAYLKNSIKHRYLQIKNRELST